VKAVGFNTPDSGQSAPFSPDDRDRARMAELKRPDKTLADC
jgi:hypothetical protein